MSARAWPLTIAATLACACGGDDDKEPAGEPFFPRDFASTYTLVRDCRFSIEHDGVSIRVYANDTAAQSYRDGTYPLPEGAILVKQQHTDGACADLVGFTAMRKLGADDWEWQEVDAEHAVRAKTNAARCVSCHADCTQGRDMTCTDP